MVVLTEVCALSLRTCYTSALLEGLNTPRLQMKIIQTVAQKFLHTFLVGFQKCLCGIFYRSLSTLLVCSFNFVGVSLFSLQEGLRSSRLVHFILFSV